MGVELQPPVPAPAAPAFTFGHEPALTFDERWAAWQAKGAAHDRAVRRRLAIAAPLSIVVAAVILYALLAS